MSDSSTQNVLFDSNAWLGERTDFNPEAEPFQPDPAFDQAMFFAAGFDNTINSFGALQEVKDSADTEDMKDMKDMIRSAISLISRH